MGMLGGSTPVSPAAAPPPRAGRRALVVEDSADLAAELAELLSGQGMHVLNVHSVEQVNGELVEFSPQACIVDLNLRGGRGAEMLGLVSKLFPSAGAILLADEVDADYVTEALSHRQQQTECVSKPVSATRLLGAVSRCVAAYDAARERQRIGAEIGALHGRLQQAGDTANAVLANLSHELRTPLNAIIGFSEMVSQDNAFPAERLKGYAQDIRQSGLHMLRVIESVLTFAALESGQHRIDAKPFDVAPMLERQLTALQPAARAAGVILTRKIVGRLPRLGRAR
jgi:signal transduction histidine kinase